MKKLWIVLGWLTFIGCSDQEELTTFQGEVLLPDTYDLANTRVYIAGIKANGIGTPSDQVIDTLLVLDENNFFSGVLPAVNVHFYEVAIALLIEEQFIEDLLLHGDRIDCSSCVSLTPGKNHNLTIEVTR
ncbi:hypothetical protein [Tunicatimonas pelagia]|uniref:hypothetical protein n=1 Tax=Tunicatimonas pelagia TaxID=931531 RepID=UPI0026670AB6|nr:hypothetical protein [Tunicatimonas pelagia]WKN43691.1 hypothetical protein P0M28_01740 [Tunicatimonas pelagia]